MTSNVLDDVGFRANSARAPVFVDINLMPAVQASTRDVELQKRPLSVLFERRAFVWRDVKREEHE